MSAIEACTINTDDYLKRGENAEEILKTVDRLGIRQHLDSRIIEDLEVQKKRSEVFDKVCDVIDFDFHVANDVSDSHVAGFATEDGKGYLVEGILDRPIEEVLEVARHEIFHINDFQKGKKSIDLKQNVTQNRLSVLDQSLQDVFGGKVASLADVNLIEGLTQFRTLKEHGEHLDCAYNHFEVPVIERLEEMSNNLLGISLVEAYEKSLGLFYETLGQLCDAILARELVFALKQAA